MPFFSFYFIKNIVHSPAKMSSIFSSSPGFLNSFVFNCWPHKTIQQFLCSDILLTAMIDLLLNNKKPQTPKSFRAMPKPYRAAREAREWDGNVAERSERNRRSDSRRVNAGRNVCSFSVGLGRGAPRRFAADIRLPCRVAVGPWHLMELAFASNAEM